MPWPSVKYINMMCNAAIITDIDYSWPRIMACTWEEVQATGHITLHIKWCEPARMELSPRHSDRECQSALLSAMTDVWSNHVCSLTWMFLYEDEDRTVALCDAGAFVNL